MEKDIINVIDENGNNIEIEVLDIFSIKEYPNKEYIMYTKNEVEGDYVKTYISILKENDDEAVLDEIVDDEEFNLIKTKIEKGELFE